MCDPHDHVPEFLEEWTLEGLCEEVCNHDTGRAVCQVYFSARDAILDKEVADINMSGALSGRGAAVALHFHGTHVVL